MHAAESDVHASSPAPSPQLPPPAGKSLHGYTLYWERPQSPVTSSPAPSLPPPQQAGRSATCTAPPASRKRGAPTGGPRRPWHRLCGREGRGRGKGWVSARDKIRPTKCRLAVAEPQPCHSEQGHATHRHRCSRGRCEQSNRRAAPLGQRPPPACSAGRTPELLPASGEGGLGA